MVVVALSMNAVAADGVSPGAADGVSPPYGLITSHHQGEHRLIRGCMCTGVQLGRWHLTVLANGKFQGIS